VVLPLHRRPLDQNSRTKRAGQQPAIDQLALIPGTRSLWATGGFDPDAGEAILEYAP
jgi:hypothetical protein